MTFETWLPFCATELVLSLTPGIAVTLVLSTALAAGARAGLRASLGTLAANALYFALSATSLGALLAASPRLFLAVRFGGALYLVVLGVQALRDARAAHRARRAAGPSGASAPPRPFARGFVMQAANPKARLFFVAIVPQFIAPGASVPRQILVLGASSIAIELGVLSAYAIVAARARTLASDPRWAAGLDLLAGALLVFAGVGLAALRA